MPKFMQQHTEEKAGKEQHPRERRFQAAFGAPIQQAHKSQQDQEGVMDVHIHTQDASEFE